MDGVKPRALVQTREHLGREGIRFIRRHPRGPRDGSACKKGSAYRGLGEPLGVGHWAEKDEQRERKRERRLWQGREVEGARRRWRRGQGLQGGGKFLTESQRTRGPGSPRGTRGWVWARCGGRAAGGSGELEGDRLEGAPQGGARQGPSGGWAQSLHAEPSKGRRATAGPA